MFLLHSYIHPFWLYKHSLQPAHRPAVGLPTLPSTMPVIKIISYVVIATFLYRKANILCRWSNILRIFYGNKGLCHCCRSYWFRWKLAMLHKAFEQLWYENLCCVSVQVHCTDCRKISWLFILWTHSCLHFFYRLTTCTCWTAQWLGHCWRWPTQTELADWQ